MDKVIPRRPLDDDNPEGYLESDQDFVMNNLEAAVELLEKELEKETQMENKEAVGKLLEIYKNKDNADTREIVQELVNWLSDGYSINILYVNTNEAWSHMPKAMSYNRAVNPTKWPKVPDPDVEFIQAAKWIDLQA